MTILHELTSPTWIRPLGWALVHSAWQVAALACLCRALLELAGGRPRVRYVSSLVAMTTALALFVLTFGILPPAGEPRVGGAAMEHSTGAAAAVGSEPVVADRDGPTAAIEPVLGAVVAVWLGGAMLAAATLLRALWGGRALRRPAPTPTPVELVVSVSALRRRMAVSREVEVLCVDWIESPMTLGWLRPVILVPRRMASACVGLLPAIAHELAHVRRHDYPVNLVQTAVERLFFYHPAMRWLSRQAREAREELCDDLAARHCDGGVAAYARGLALLEETRSAPAFGLAVGEGRLLARVRRLIAPARRAPARMALTAATLGVLGAVTVGVWLLPASLAASTVLDGLDPVHLLAGRTTPGSPSVAVRMDGYRYLFADRASRERFLGDPARYAVRNRQVCPLTGRRVRPDSWRVVDGQIVLFCCPEVPERALAQPRRLLARLARD